jgi:crotonobetainyl-CoA:carnitine CoA-transferase CaiB-like acyl-CoA transferase
MTQDMSLPLEGVRVIELATVVAAPTAGRMLCAYGAEVIKVETAIGDEMRRAGEFEMVPCGDDGNPLFTIQNSGKTLTSINLKAPEGKEAFLRLLEGADVLLTNVRLPSLGRLGLDYGTLHEKHPRLIYAHFSGFGTRGPDAARPGFDSTAFWLRTGPMADWQAPGSFPFTPTYAFGDMATSSVFLSGILMALIGRERTGKGTFVSTSLFASGIWCNAIGVVSHQPQFGGARTNDPLRPADPFCQLYKCADGRWIGVYDNEYCRDLPKFAALLGVPDILDDPRCASLESLRETDAVAELTQRLNGIFLTRSSGEWLKLFEENNISCELMRSLRDVSTDEQAAANGYIQKLDFGDGLEAVMPCPPIKFSEYSVRPYTSAGALGADTDRVFSELGYSREEIDNMRKSGAIK